MKHRFSEALKVLGHFYPPRTELQTPERVRHIVKVYTPTGEVKAICGASTYQYGLGCPELWPDSNCAECRTIAGVVPSITKRSLMLELVNSVCDIEQMFLDAMYWNYHNPERETLNPDEDGELAQAWLSHRAQLVSMLDRFGPTMGRHEGTFGWPEELEDGERK